MTKRQSEYHWAARHEALYRVELSVLYHQKREKFFDVFDKFAKIMSVLGGAVVIARVLSPDQLTGVAALSTVSSAVSLVFGLSDKAKRHSELAKNFRRLEADIHSKGVTTFTDLDIASWNAKIRELEAGEPAPLATLTMLCQNKLAIAQNQPEKVIKINLFKKIFSHLF